MRITTSTTFAQGAAERSNVRPNFWVPDVNFADAFDASLQPARLASENQTFFYEVDEVEVRRHQPVQAAAGER
jgi:hypothetical protein